MHVANHTCESNSSLAAVQPLHPNQVPSKRRPSLARVELETTSTPAPDSQSALQIRSPALPAHKAPRTATALSSSPSAAAKSRQVLHQLRSPIARQCGQSLLPRAIRKVVRRSRTPAKI